MSFLDFPGLQYFYNKYLKPIKPHAREETIKSYTVNEQGHVPDAQLVVQLKEENESLQEEIEKLNSSLTKIHLFNVSEISFGYDSNVYYIEFLFSEDNKYRLFCNETGIAFSRWDGSKWTELWAK